MEWGFSIASYMVLSGLAAGTFFSGTMAEIFSKGKYKRLQKYASYTSLVLMPIALLILAIHLGQTFRFWRVMTNFNSTSVISLGAWISTVFTICVFLSAASWYLGWKDGLRKLFSYIALPFSFLVAGYTGNLLSHTAVPLWRATPYLGVLFMISSAAAGLAVLLAVATSAGDVKERTLGLMARATIATVIIKIVVNVVFINILALTNLELLSSGQVTGQVIGFLLSIIAIVILAPLAKDLFHERVNPANMPKVSTLITLAAMIILVEAFLLRYEILTAQLYWFN
ncbi:polysulfide reductase NrfD [Natroniella sulfidigena]|uniref:NrfD/PsrC family molybdoenzyme membrane anchor subunit n=1 Tax=Natroniella sulfidigena TaxID=723921 RepID=UPI00200A61AE|nr:NrfD/PsrC family molybdoenzyme membrane anchor subunit [Natroniella sulfidigena]MCK8815958.1 polysulfide reductase NrfD [Natroniella sulfidigena]